MDAQTGINFLRVLRQEKEADQDDVVKAVQIAGTHSPSGAFHAGELYFVGRYGRVSGYLAFAKGTRWLAVLRRDEGARVFQMAVSQLFTQEGVELLFYLLEDGIIDQKDIENAIKTVEETASPRVSVLAHRYFIGKYGQGTRKVPTKYIPFSKGVLGLWRIRKYQSERAYQEIVAELRQTTAMTTTPKG